jgi:CRISPR-associated endonuclease Cas1 subtype II
MGYMVVRGEDTKRIFLDEIAILLIENSAVSLTGCLLVALIEKKIKVIFCDEKRNPCAELVAYYGSHDCSRKIKLQANWSDYIKGTIWTEVVSDKIRKQSKVLDLIGKAKESNMLKQYLTEIEFNDSTNREGHAAKVYLNALFGLSFSRTDENITNAALNYGYSLILSAFNREITANGYLTQMGIFHDNIFNYFNFSSDLMEPFRPYVDKYVFEKNFTEFEKEEKYSMISLLHEKIIISNTQQTLLNAIKLYTRSVFEAINDNDVSLITFPRL